MNKQQKEKVIQLFDNSHYSDNDYLALAERVRKAVSEKNGNIYCKVDHVSNSGMIRHISVYINSCSHGLECLNNTPFNGVFADRSRVEKSGGCYISGCGTDMLFEATYRIYCFFYPYKKGVQTRPYQKHLNRYSTL